MELQKCLEKSDISNFWTKRETSSDRKSVLILLSYYKKDTINCPTKRYYKEIATSRGDRSQGDNLDLIDLLLSISELDGKLSRFVF